jgi:hypothetical protein
VRKAAAMSHRSPCCTLFGDLRRLRFFIGVSLHRKFLLSGAIDPFVFPGINRRPRRIRDGLAQICNGYSGVSSELLRDLFANGFEADPAAARSRQCRCLLSLGWEPERGFAPCRLKPPMFGGRKCWVFNLPGLTRFNPGRLVARGRTRDEAERHASPAACAVNSNPTPTRTAPTARATR